MNQTDARLVVGFLTEKAHEFAEYIDNQGIDPLEATVIIEGIMLETGVSGSKCVDDPLNFDPR